MNSYTQNITFAKCNENPIYMRTLKVIIDNPNGISKLNVMRQTHPHYTWLKTFTKTPRVNNGPFSMLTHYNFATIKRMGNTFLYQPTQHGIEFYNLVNSI